MNRQITAVLLLTLVLLGMLRLTLPTAAQGEVSPTPSNAMQLALPVAVQVPQLTPTATPTAIDPHIVYFTAQNGENTPVDDVVLLSTTEQGSVYAVAWGANVDLRWEISHAETVTLESKRLSEGVVVPLGARPLSGTESLIEVTISIEYRVIAENAFGDRTERTIILNVGEHPTPTPTATPTATPRPMTCGISINAGALLTQQRAVTLHLTAEGATQMQLSNDGGFAGAAWQPFDPEVAWTLSNPAIENEKVTLNVYARFWNGQSDYGCAHGSFSDDIIYAPPTTP